MSTSTREAQVRGRFRKIRTGLLIVCPQFRPQIFPVLRGLRRTSRMRDDRQAARSALRDRRPWTASAGPRPRPRRMAQGLRSAVLRRAGVAFLSNVARALGVLDVAGAAPPVPCR